MPVMGFQRTIKISVMAHLASHANVTQGDGVGFGFFFRRSVRENHGI